MAYTKQQVDEAVERGIGMGWAYYTDSAYTVGSPLSIASAKTQITIDGLGSTTNTTYLPEGVTEFWNTTTNKIIAQRVGDSFDTRLEFKAKSSAKDSNFDVTFDIGDGGSIVVAGQTLVCPKTALVETRYVVDIPLFALATFILNGCKIYIDTSISPSTLSVYDIGIFIKRDYTNPV